LLTDTFAVCALHTLFIQQRYIEVVDCRFKYMALVIAWTTKLTGVVTLVFTHNYFYGFLTVFNVFQKPKNVTFTFFCRVAYISRTTTAVTKRLYIIRANGKQ